MTLKLSPHTPRALLAAGLLFSIGAAHAAGGFTINPDQERLVHPGMSTAEVLQTLGRPSRNVQYPNEPGPTYTYEVLGTEPGFFDVDFGADGKVVSVNERMDSTGGRD